MSLTVRLVDNQGIRISDQIIEPRPPDRVELAVEGVLTITENVLSQFEGTTLKPKQVVVSGDESGAVTVDLEEASLRLETMDVGVETPDADDISPGMDSFPTSPDDAESLDTRPGAIAFTLEGAILETPKKTLEMIPDESVTLDSITFATEETMRSDGGSDERVLLEVTLVGYTVVIYRNGSIEVGTLGGGSDINLP